MKPARGIKLPPFALTHNQRRYPIREQDDGSYRLYAEGIDVPVVGPNHARRQAEDWERAGIMPPEDSPDV